MGLDIWMFIAKIGVFETEGTGRVLDRVQEAGIRTLVLGDLIFDGKPAYPATPVLYEGCETQPPEMPTEHVERFEILQKAVEEARRRGLGVYLHDCTHPPPGLPKGRDPGFCTTRCSHACLG